MSGGCQERVTKVEIRFLNGLDMLCGWCQEGDWRVSGRCQEGMGRVSERCVERIWNMSA